jgi:hypothetical protein
MQDFAPPRAHPPRANRVLEKNGSTADSVIVQVKALPGV